MTKKKDSAEKAIRDIPRATRRQYSAEEKIRIVLEGLRGESTVSALCRREGIHTNMYYKWSKAFLESGKNGLTRDTLRDASTSEVQHLKAENSDLKKAVAELTLDVIRYKKSLGM